MQNSCRNDANGTTKLPQGSPRFFTNGIRVIRKRVLENSALKAFQKTHCNAHSNLQNDAFEGFSGQRKFVSAGSQIREKFAMDNGGTMPVPGSEFFTCIGPLQKMVKEIIMNEVFPSDGQEWLGVACIDRWTKLFLPYDI